MERKNKKITWNKWNRCVIATGLKWNRWNGCSTCSSCSTFQRLHRRRSARGRGLGGLDFGTEFRFALLGAILSALAIDVHSSSVFFFAGRSESIPEFGMNADLLAASWLVSGFCFNCQQESFLADFGGGSLGLKSATGQALSLLRDL